MASATGPIPPAPRVAAGGGLVPGGGLRRSLMWMTVVRAVVALAVLGVMWAETVEGVSPVSLYQAMVAVGALLVVDVLWWAWVRSGRRLRTAAWIQLATDVGVVTWICLVTGGISDRYPLLFLLVVLGGALVGGQRAGLTLASICTVALAGVTVLYSLALEAGEVDPLPALVGADMTESLVRVVRDDVTDPARVSLALVLLALVLHITGILGGRMSQTLARVRLVTDELLMSLGEGVLSWDIQGRTVFVNSRAAELLELPAARPGAPLDEVLADDRLRALRDLCEGLEEGRHEVEIRTGTGHTMPLGVTLTALLDERGRRIGGVAVLADLTLRQAMQRARREAERLTALSQMAAGMAHELRNPLAGIRGSLQELERNEDLGDDDRKLLAVVMRESDRLDHIIDDFLSFARRRPLRVSPVNLSEAVDEWVLPLRRRPDAADVEVHTHTEGDVEVRADREAIAQVILNLGINALEAIGARDNGAAGGRVGITVQPAPDGGAEIRVEDDGPGIPPDEQARLFTPFHTTKSDGVGMGLAISRRIVHDHGGRIVCESERGTGTVFRVLLPARPPAPGREEQ